MGASLKELRQPASASERPRQMETLQKPRFSGPHHHRAGGDHDYGGGAGGDHGGADGDHGDGGGAGHESKHGVGLEHYVCVFNSTPKWDLCCKDLFTPTINHIQLFPQNGLEHRLNAEKIKSTIDLGGVGLCCKYSPTGGATPLITY